MTGLSHAGTEGVSEALTGGGQMNAMEVMGSDGRPLDEGTACLTVSRVIATNLFF